MPLPDIVVFPHMVAPLIAGREKSVNALYDAMNKDKLVFLSTQKNADQADPTQEDMSSLGTIGRVLQVLRLPDGSVKALVEGRARARIAKYEAGESFHQVEVETVEDEPVSEAQKLALSRAITESFDVGEDPHEGETWAI